MDDPIVDEVRRIRDAYAARFNYDLDAIFRDIKEQEARAKHSLIVVSELERSGHRDASSDPNSSTITLAPVR